jgi:uncharacterized protein (TIGR04255 family)
MSVPAVKYPNPPIQEAICEIHFDLPQPLAKVQLESLMPSWSTDYPDQSFIEERGITIQVGANGVQTTDRDDLGHRLICKSFDGKRLVQVSGQFLAVNQLRPYPGWEEGFRDAISNRAAELQTALGNMAFRRIGLRYINRIDIPEVPLFWKTWFNFDLPSPALEGSIPRQFQMQFNSTLPRECRLTINLVLLPPIEAGKSSVILDLDVIWEGARKDFSDLASLLERVHQPHRLAFEAYLNEKTRKLFL